MEDEPLQEGELIRVFLGAHGVAVRQIDARHPHHAVSGRDDRLDIARLGVVLVARQAARDLERPLGKNGDAVECLLPMGLDVVAKLLDLHPRKLLVEALDFLQAKNVRLHLLQVSEKVRQPLTDGIDVPGGDAQARGLLKLIEQDRHCERSEAIQESLGALQPLDCFVALLLAMTIPSHRVLV